MEVIIRRVVFCLTVMIFMLRGSTIYAKTFEFEIYRPNISIEMGVDEANKELSDITLNNTYFKYYVDIDALGRKIEIAASESVWNNYGIFSSDEPSGKRKYVEELESYLDIPNNQNEFIGKSNFDDLVPNPYYPVDSFPTSEIMGRWVWVEEPERPTVEHKEFISRKSRDYLNALSLEDQTEFVNQLIIGLEDDYGDMFDEAMARAEGREAWLSRAGVVIPPTKVSRGVVRLWHSGGAWYTNVIMNPLYHFQPEFRIEAQGGVYTDERLLTRNSSEQIELVNMTSMGTKDITESIKWYVDGVLIKEDTKAYTYDSISNSKLDLLISSDTLVKLEVKVKDNPEIKSVTHRVDYIQQALLGIAGGGGIDGDVIIGSDEPGSHDFDVVQGIPTNKDIYAQVMTDEYIFDYDFVLVNDSNTFVATITGVYDNGDGTTTAFSESETVSRSYSYYNVDWYVFYGIDEARVYNYALPGDESRGVSKGQVKLEPTNYNVAATYTLGGIDSSPSDESEDVGLVSRSYDFKNKADAMIDNYSTHEGQITLTGISSGGTSASGITSKSIQHGDSKPIVAKTDRTLYKELVIETTLANKEKTPTSASVTYSIKNEFNSGATGTKVVQLVGNTVTVQSPVVCYPSVIEEDLNHNGMDDRLERTQNRITDPSITQLIIGESFEVKYPLSGQHKTIQGYGNRDYSDSTKNRQIQFSFDVYRGSDDSGSVLRAGEWHDYVEGGEDYTRVENQFFIPAWNDESDKGSILCRTIPNNSQNLLRDGYGYKFNDNIDEYKAVESLKVALSSKVYGFTVTDINDPNWDSYFAKGDTSYLTAARLPVMPNKNTEVAYSDYAIKLGYEARFNLSTNGEMTGRDDILVIRPSYDHVDSDGRNRQEVAIYYESKAGFVRLGSEQDTMANKMTLNIQGRGIEGEELRDTAKVLVSQNRSVGYDEGTYYKALSGDYAYNLKNKDQMVLTEMQKTYVGKMVDSSASRPSYLSEETLKESEQKWYGEFYLPSQSLVVPIGTDLSSFDHLKIGQGPFLSDGYIIVNFTIDVYHDITGLGDLATASPYLSYDNDHNGNHRGNMWEMELFDTNQFGEPFLYGDALFYHVNKRASDDYE